MLIEHPGGARHCSEHWKQLEKDIVSPLKNIQSYLGYEQANNQLKHSVITTVLLFLNEKYLVGGWIYNLK